MPTQKILTTKLKTTELIKKTQITKNKNKSLRYAGFVFLSFTNNKSLFLAGIVFKLWEQCYF